MDDLDQRFRAAYRLVSLGRSADALSAAQSLLREAPDNQSLRMNCAGIYIDAGERLHDLEAVREGVRILDQLNADGGLPKDYQHAARYNLANGKSALLRIGPDGEPTNSPDVRDMHLEEEVVALYYADTSSLRAATPERVINCASVLRVQSRVYEAIDLLDHVLRGYPDHPHAHQKMAEMLWAAAAHTGFRDSCLEALLVPALVHYSRSVQLFENSKEPEFATQVQASAENLRVVAGDVLHGDVDDLVSDAEGFPLKSGARLGSPLGLQTLARSPYRDADDPRLVDGLELEVLDVIKDAVGTYSVGRSFLRGRDTIDVGMPDWGDVTPSVHEHLVNASIRQFWSVLEKVAWLVNTAFSVGLSEKTCSFHSVFAPPSKDVKHAYGLPLSPGAVRFHPKLCRRNYGLRALAGLSCAFDADKGGAVYVPLKKLRHTLVHRISQEPASTDDAAFLMGIARAALMHGVDAVVINQARLSQP